MALTLLEAKKASLESGDTMRAGIVEVFGRNAPILNRLDFLELQGNTYRYLKENQLSDTSFRGVNELPTSSTGTLDSELEKLSILSGQFDMDRFIVETEGVAPVARQWEMKAKSMVRNWERAFLKGDPASDAREIVGLQRRLGDDRKLSAGSTVGGAALSLFALDEAISDTDGCNALLMNTKMRLRLTKAFRDAVGGETTTTRDDFGRQVFQYNGIPVIEMGKDGVNDEILAFDELDSVGATPTATSVYCLQFGGDGLLGLQNGGIKIFEDGGSEIIKPYNVEWYLGMVLHSQKAATRIEHVGDLAIVE